MKKWVVGIDEVGRGPVAGPVYVCAVAIQEDDYKKSKWVGLTDSKLMTKKSREKWNIRAMELKKQGLIKVSISSRCADKIDMKGIAVCIKESVNSAIKTLKLDPESTKILLDGGLKAPEVYKQKTIIKGDQKERLISMASVIAKVRRDRLMDGYHKKYPIYGWDKNKGYGTKSHILSLKKAGLTEFHRKSFLSRAIDK